MFDPEALDPGQKRSFHSAELPIGTPITGSGYEQKSKDESYDEFYSRGGWTYDAAIEGAFLEHHIINPLQISQEAVMLELGCGTGFHARLFARLGLSVTALDASQAAITNAKASGDSPSGEEVDFVCADASSFLKDKEECYDLVFTRAMSWFHYELEPGMNVRGVDVRKEMTAVMRALRPRGLFVLQVRTDYSGAADWTGIRNHTRTQSYEFFNSLGRIELLSDWRGRSLLQECDGPEPLFGLLGAIRKPSL